MKTQDGQRKTYVTSRALVLAMALAVTVGAQAASPWQQVCIDAWADAPASDVCTGGTTSRIGASGSVQTPSGTCSVRAITCTVTATTQGGEEKSWTLNPMWQEYSPARTQTLDVCFAVVTSSSTSTATETVTVYNVKMRTGCNEGETGSADMQGSTLPY